MTTYKRCFKMSAEAIHLLGLPLKHNVPCFWKRQLFVTQFGTVGADVSGGTGYVHTNKEFYLVLNTGGNANSWQRRHADLPYKLNIAQEWENGTFVRRDFGFSNRFFGLGNSPFVTSVHTYTDNPANVQYACLFFVRDATYNHRILAQTRNPAGVTRTDCGAWEFDKRYILRVEHKEANAKFYVNGVLKATHTTNLPWVVETAYMKVEISNQAANDESEAFYNIRGMVDYP